MKAVQKGFSLLELIAVMAIMAILAGAMAPNIASRIDAAYRDAERDNLATLAQNLREAIVEQKRIPSMRAQSWTQAIASVSAYSAGRIARNDKGYRRRLLIDPQFYSDSARPSREYVQNRGLRQRPYSPRMMLVSSLGGELRLPALGVEAFDAIWNQYETAVLREGGDVLIERIHLAAYFHRLVLSNRHSSERPFFQLENGDRQALPRARNNADSSVTRYVLHNTQIALYQAPFPSGSKQQTALVQSDTAMRYQPLERTGSQDDDDDNNNRGGRERSATGGVWVQP